MKLYCKECQHVLDKCEADERAIVAFLFDHRYHDMVLTDAEVSFGKEFVPAVLVSSGFQGESIQPFSNACVADFYVEKAGCDVRTCEDCGARIEITAYAGKSKVYHVIPNHTMVDFPAGGDVHNKCPRCLKKFFQKHREEIDKPKGE